MCGSGLMELGSVIVVLIAVRTLVLGNGRGGTVCS